MFVSFESRCFSFNRDKLLQEKRCKKIQVLVLSSFSWKQVHSLNILHYLLWESMTETVTPVSSSVRQMLFLQLFSSHSKAHPKSCSLDQEKFLREERFQGESSVLISCNRTLSSQTSLTQISNQATSGILKVSINACHDIIIRLLYYFHDEGMILQASVNLLPWESCIGINLVFLSPSDLFLVTSCLVPLTSHLFVFVMALSHSQTLIRKIDPRFYPGILTREEEGEREIELLQE